LAIADDSGSMSNSVCSSGVDPQDLKNVCRKLSIQNGNAFMAPVTSATPTTTSIDLAGRNPRVSDRTRAGKKKEEHREVMNTEVQHATLTTSPTEAHLQHVKSISKAKKG